MRCVNQRASPSRRAAAPRPLRTCARAARSHRAPPRQQPTSPAAFPSGPLPPSPRVRCTRFTAPDHHVCTRAARWPQIRRAYKTLRTRAHPDKGGDAALFAAVTRAHDVLSDPDKVPALRTPPLLYCQCASRRALENEHTCVKKGEAVSELELHGFALLDRTGF
jgi:trans-2-enoyl-CoA reductase